MVGFIESASGAVKNLFCDALRGGSNFVGLFPENIATDAISNTLDSASLNLCSRNGSSGGGGAGGSWSGGIAPPPFTGGQCAGVNYRIQARGNVPSISTQPSLTNASLINVTRIGAITNVGIRDNPTNYVLFVTHAGGTSDITNFSKTSWGQPVFTSITVTRVDGLPDTCGNLPSTRPPSIEELEDVIPEIAYDDIDGNPVSLPNVPIKFFPPCLNLDGARIPFEITTPLGKLCGKIGIAGDFPKGVEPSIDIDLCPSQKEDLGLNTPELEDYFEVSSPIGVSVSSEFNGTLNEDFDLEQLPIMGVFVNSQYEEQPFSQTVLDQLGVKPNLIIPNIGYVIFQYLIPTGETTYESAFSSEIPIKITNQFIPCPYPFGAVGVQVRWASNWQGNYRIAKRKSCCKNCSEASPEEIVDKLDRCRLD